MAIGKHIFNLAKTGSSNNKTTSSSAFINKKWKLSKISLRHQKKLRSQIRQFHDITYDYSDKFYSYPS